MSLVTGGANTGSPEEVHVPSRDDVFSRAVGKCPIANVKLGGVPVPCLLDSGSEVSTITESFFNENFRSKGKSLLSTSGWLTLTAANGLNIPYIGYFELDVETFGITIPKRRILVVKDSEDPVTRRRKQEVPGLLGMNVIGQVRKETKDRPHLKDTTSEWADVLQLSSERATTARGFAKVSGKQPVLIPAGSVAMVAVTGWRAKHKKDTALIEPIAGPLPGGLLVVNTLTKPMAGQMFARVVNLKDEDVWLSPRTRIGVFHVTDRVQNPKHKVEISRISVNEAEVTLNSEKASQAKAADCPVDLTNVNCTPEEKEELRQLLLKHADVFVQEGDELGYTETYKHRIPTTDDVPVSQPFQRIPPTQYQEVKDHIQKLLEDDIIQESHSPYASPVVIVRKKDGSMRLCVDYRRLNAKTVRDAFPLPRIEESLDAVGDAKWFSTLDLASGFNQVAMDPADRHKTALITPFGLYEYNRMPFGLTNAPATFSRLMQRCLNELIFQILLVYLDDIIVYSGTFKEHLD